MRLIHYYAPLLDQPAGVTAAIAVWARAQHAAGHEVALLGAPSNSAARQDYPPEVALATLRHRGTSRLTRVPVGLGPRLAGADLLVLHEGWTTSHYAAAAAAKRARVPYVLVPHGVHNPRWMAMMRALPARRPIERRLVEGAAAVQVFFAGETAQTRALAPRARFVVAPTGYDLPDDGDRWTGGGAALLWIGRYSVEHKGLDLLLDALAAIPAAERPRLVLRGYDYRGGEQLVRDAVGRLGLGRHVTVGPPVETEAEKGELLRGCRGWVQPSRWESHSIALLEALSRGVPALVSDTMPIASDLARHDAAIVSPLDTAALAGNVARLAAGGAEYGPRGRAFVAGQLNWPAAVAAFDRQVAALLEPTVRREESREC